MLFSARFASDDSQSATRFHLELPDGPRVAHRSADISRAMIVIDTACVECLVEPSSRARDRLAWPQDCE